jgi:hypothetical protein
MRRRGLAALHHFMQVSCRRLSIIVPALTGAALGGEHATSMDFSEVPVGKFVVSLGVFRPLVVDPQIPFAVFGKTVEADIFAFLPGRRLMFAPGIALVKFKSSFSDKRFGMFICSSIKLHGH